METIKIDAIVETPCGSAQKYKYNAITQSFNLLKLLPKGMVFPFDFGFVPNTNAADGDPLDIILLNDFPTFTGCHVTCRLIGAITAQQSYNNRFIRNDRLIGVFEKSLIYQHVQNINDLPDSFLKQTEQFFQNYLSAEQKQFIPLERISAQQAYELIHSSSF